MGWENHGRRRYYYSKKRESGRVISEYVGAGPVAELVAQAESAQQDYDRAERESRRFERQAEQVIAADVDRAGAFIRALLGVALAAEGCYQHKGQWRR